MGDTIRNYVGVALVAISSACSVGSYLTSDNRETPDAKLYSNASRLYSESSDIDLELDWNPAQKYFGGSAALTGLTGIVLLASTTFKKKDEEHE